MACKATVAVTTCAITCSSTYTFAAAVLRAIGVVTGPFERAARALDHLRQTGDTGFVKDRMSALRFGCWGTRNTGHDQHRSCKKNSERNECSGS
jgi:hypothetical protein